MDTLLLEKNKDVAKLNVLHLDIMAMRNLFSEISRNNIFLTCFSLIRAYSLDAQTDIQSIRHSGCGTANLSQVKGN